MTPSQILRGPAIIQFGGTDPVNTLYTEDDIVLNVDLEHQEMMCSMYGRYDDLATNVKIDISFNPCGTWQGGGEAGADFIARAALLLPYMSSLPGECMTAQTYATMKPTVIWTKRDGMKYTFPNTFISKMGTIQASKTKLLLGNMTISAVRALAADSSIQAWSATDSIYTAAADAFDDTNFSSSDVLYDTYTAVWGSVTGFSSAIPTVDGFTIEPTISPEAETSDNYGIVNYLVGGAGVGLTCRFQPLGGMTLANIMAAMKISGTGGALGMSLSTIQSSSLVISGSASGRPKFTIPVAQLTSPNFAFGAATRNIGEMTFKAARQITANVPASLLTVGAVT